MQIDEKRDSPVEPVWLYDDAPPQPGWYAVLVCYGPPEGLISGKAYWQGAAWNTSSPITSFAGPFATEDAAATWAEANNPEY